MSATTGSRRRLRRLGLVLAGLALLLPGHWAAAEEGLTAVSWGGAYTKSQILGFIRPYEAETGVEVEVIDYAGGLEEIRSQVRAWNVKWDVVDLELFDAIRACDEDLLVAIDPQTLPPAPDGTPATEDFLEGALTPCGVGGVAWSTVIAYDRKRVERAPRTLEDFFNVQDFPGKRGMRRTPKANLEWALIADGVEPERVYDVLETPDGVDRAFKVLARVKPLIRWWRLGEDAVRLLETGRVTMTTAYSGRIYDAVQRGEPFEISWDHQILNIDVWGVPKHGEHTERALDFVRYATSTEALASQAEYIPYGPLRRSSLKRVDPDMRPHLPTAEANRKTAFDLDAAWWAEHLDELDARFERWLDRPVQVPRYMPH